jgi:hypothetical protein
LVSREILNSILIGHYMGTFQKHCLKEPIRFRCDNKSVVFPLKPTIELHKHRLEYLYDEPNIPVRKKDIPEFDLRELNRIVSCLSRESRITGPP